MKLLHCIGQILLCTIFCKLSCIIYKYWQCIIKGFLRLPDMEHVKTRLDKMGLSCGWINQNVENLNYLILL